MTDVSNEYSNNVEGDQPLRERDTFDRQMDTNLGISLPVNRVIRKRFAARTIGIHLSALPPELRALKNRNGTYNNTYLCKQDLPEEIHLTLPSGEVTVLSKDDAWIFADEAGAQLEWHMLPDTMSGKATALLSTTGQGVYANYGRPTMDFSGFFYDSIRASGKISKRAIASQESILLGPIFITLDAISAAGFTALGHTTRGAPLTNKAVFADIISTGIYEGSTSWSSAKLGVFTGVKTMRLAAALPIPGVHLAAIPVGFLTGAITAIFAKHFANQYKDKAIDATYRSGRKPISSKVTQNVIPV